MNAAIQQWLDARAVAPGMLACGVRESENLCLCHSADRGCPPEKMEKILHQLADAQPWLFKDAPAPRWSTWTFEQGKLRIVHRADGLLLGLAVRVDTDAAQNLDVLSEEFLALPAGA